MGWTTEDPMFDPRHRQVSRPDSCLVGCDDVSLGVSRRFEGNDYLLLEYLTSEDEGITSLRNVGTRPKKRHAPEDTNFQKHQCWNLKRTIVQTGSGGHPAC
jgi:hypothetical protein